LFNETAMMALGQMGDERAVPTLVGVLLDTRNSFDQNIGTAGQALARCGSEGFKALVKALDHEDARARRASGVRLGISGTPRSFAYLDRMEHDPDPTVSSRAKMRIGKSLWD